MKKVKNVSPASGSARSIIVEDRSGSEPNPDLDTPKTGLGLILSILLVILLLTPMTTQGVEEEKKSSEGTPKDLFAPVPDVPQRVPDRQFYTLVLKNLAERIPDKKAVGIPPYPGATAVSLGKGTGKFHVIYLATDDAVAKVVAFYKKQLSGWNYEPKDESTWFWQGEAELEAVSSLETELPAVGIRPLKVEYFDKIITPGAKTRIAVQYKAPEEEKAKTPEGEN